MTRFVRLTGPRQRAYAHAELDKAPDGWVMTLREPTRTLEQNARFHAMIDDLVRQKPEGRTHDKDTWKAIIVRALRKEMRFERDLDGEMFPLPKRSSEMTVREMSDAIEIMNAYAAQHGVVWTEREPE